MIIAALLAAAIVIEGDCPRSIELAMEVEETIRITGTRQQTRIEMFDPAGRRLAEKTLTAPATCDARAEAIAVLISAWTLELGPQATPALTAENHQPAAQPQPEPRAPNYDGARAKLSFSKPTLPPTPPQSHRWLAITTGLAVFAGGLSLNLASERDSGLDQPTDFVPLLLYITGATLFGAGLAAD